MIAIPRTIVTLAAALWFTLAGAAPPPLPPQPGPGRLPEIAGADRPLLLRHTDVRAVITAGVAHVEVTQTWENPNPGPLDGLYIFPLPANAAVNDMRLQVGDRVIRSEMKRREEARRIYDRARSEGRIAGLLDQERPNVFVQRVANLMPGQPVQVRIAFDHEVRREEGGDYEYVFPTVVGPRFIPAEQADPSRVNPPVVPEGSSTGQTLSVTVELDAGVSLGTLRSPSHPIRVDRRGSHAATVTLADAEHVRLNKDFRLRWTAGGDRPEVGVLAWRDPKAKDARGVFTLLIEPPRNPDETDVRPRELVFVLDCSGSMRGVPLSAAKQVVRRALAAARPGDTFQIIRFSNRASGLGPVPLPVTPENVQAGLRYLDSLHGGGGTRMIEGIRAALGFPADPERLRIVAFLTDGYIGNEDEILGEVQRRIGGARLFSFGIGTSVNRYLLESLAEEGRGAAAFLAPGEKPEEMVARFVRRISTPVLTDIRITWEDLDVEDLEPGRVPDLFAGQPLLIHGRYGKPGAGVVTVEGRMGEHPVVFRRVVRLPRRAEENEALGRLWARARIHRLARELHDGPREDVKERIVRLALAHRLMSPWTSLVAVDTEISDRTGASREVVVPVEMPEGVSYEGIFGETRQVAMKGLMPAPMVYRGTRRDFAQIVRPEETMAIGRTRSDARTRRLPAAGASAVGGQVPPSRERESRVAGVRFVRLTLECPGEGRLVLEEDGELWRIGKRDRTLVTVLSAAQLNRVRVLLARAKREPAGPGGGPLHVEEPNGSRWTATIAASSPGAALAMLLREMEEKGRAISVLGKIGESPVPAGG